MQGIIYTHSYQTIFFPNKAWSDYDLLLDYNIQQLFCKLDSVLLQ